MDTETDDEVLRKFEIENRVALTRGEYIYHEPKAVLFFNREQCNSQRNCSSAILFMPPNIAHSGVPSTHKIAFYRLFRRIISTHPEEDSTLSHLQNSSLPISRVISASSSPGLPHFNLDGPTSRYSIENALSGPHEPTPALNLEESASLPPISVSSTYSNPQPQIAEETDLHSQEVTISLVSDVNSSGLTGSPFSVSQRSSSSHSRKTSCSHSSVSFHSKGTFSSRGSTTSRSKRVTLGGSTSSHSGKRSSPANHSSTSSHLQEASLPISHELLVSCSPSLLHFNLDGPTSRDPIENAPSGPHKPTPALNIEQSASLPPISVSSTYSDPQPQTAEETDLHSQEVTISLVSDVNSSGLMGRTFSVSQRSSSSHSRKTFCSHGSASFHSKGAFSSSGSKTSRSKRVTLDGSTSSHSGERSSPANHSSTSSHLQEASLPISHELSVSCSPSLLHFNLDGPTSRDPIENAPFGPHKPTPALNLEQSAPLPLILLPPASFNPQPQIVEENDLHNQEVTISLVGDVNSSGSTGRTSSELHSFSSPRSRQTASSYRLRGRPYPAIVGPVSSHLPYLPTSRELTISSSQDLSQSTFDGLSSQNLFEIAPSGLNKPTIALNLEQSAQTAASSMPQSQVVHSYIQENDLLSQEATISTVNNVNYFGLMEQTSSESQRSSSFPSLEGSYPTSQDPISSPSLERPTIHGPESSHLTSTSQGLSQFNLESHASSYSLESTPSSSNESFPPISSSSASLASVPQDENRTTSDETILSNSRTDVFVRPRPVQFPRRRTAFSRPYPPLQPPRSYCSTDAYLDMDTTLFPELYM